MQWPQMLCVMRIVKNQIPALLTGALFLVVVLGFSGFAKAEPSLATLHTVSGINVDVTARNAVQAREQAIAQAQNRALSILLQRLTLLDSVGASKLAEANPGNLVENFEIAGERSSNVRYLGEFTVQFKPQEVRRFLRENGVGFSEAFRPPMLVLPVLQGDFGNRLWDSPNPWRDIWQNASGQYQLLSLMIPSGGLNDMVAGNVDQVMAGSEEAIVNLRNRYGAESVLVAAARVIPASDTAPLRLAVEYTEFGRAIRGEGVRAGERIFGLIDTTSITLSANAGESETELMYRARAAVLDRLNRAWKQASVVTLSTESGRINMAVAISSLGEWRQVQRLLSSETAISGVTILSMAKNRARIAVDHLGSVGELRRLLAQKGLNLSAEALSVDPSLDGDLTRSQPRLIDPVTNAINDPQRQGAVISTPTYLLTLSRS